MAQVTIRGQNDSVCPTQVGGDSRAALFGIVGLASLAFLATSLPAQTRLAVKREVVTKGDDVVFKWPRKGLVDRNGNLYISEETQARRTVLVFDSAGRSIGQIGRVGRGPGEFQGVSAFGFRGDSVWVIDKTLARVTYFSPRGEVFGTQPFPPAVSGLDVLAVLGDGSVLARPTPMSRSRGFDYWGKNEADRILRLESFESSAPGKAIDSVGFVRANGAGAVEGKGLFWSPMRSEDVVAYSPDGTRFMIANARDDSGYTINAKDRRGKVFSAERRTSPVPIDRAQVERWVLRPAADGTSDRAPTDAERAQIAIFMKPRFLSAVTGLVMSPDNFTWVRREGTIYENLMTAADSVQWDVFDPRGKLAGIVTLPGKVRVLAAGRSLLWAAEEDENGVWQLVRYRVQKM